MILLVVGSNCCTTYVFGNTLLGVKSYYVTRHSKVV